MYILSLFLFVIDAFRENNLTNMYGNIYLGYNFDYWRDSIETSFRLFSVECNEWWLVYEHCSVTPLSCFDIKET